MGALKTRFFIIVILIFIISTVFSVEQESTLAALFEILYVLYDYDSSQIPSEPNEILALQTSSEPRDLLAWEIFKLIRYELDPDSRPPMEVESVISAEVSLSMAAEKAIEVESESALSFPMMMGMDSGSAEDLSGPLSDCILTPGTYRITSLPLEIEGHVIIPAGTQLIAPFDPNHAVIEVMPEGLLDMGRAAFYDAEDYPDILPAVEIVPEDPNVLYTHNRIGIYVHRGADPKTRIENVLIKSCAMGIVLDEQLDTLIRGVITFGCYDGIHLYAPAEISDCEFWYNGTVYDEIFGYVGAGIYVYPDVVEYPNPSIDISQTVVYDGDVGIYFSSLITDPNVLDPNQIPTDMHVINSCLANSYFYGIYQATGDGVSDVIYTAFGENESNVNFSAPFTGCFVLSYNPFYNRQEDWEKLYVLQGSELTDAGYGFATDGMGTSHDRPDTGILDIGCHFSIGVPCKYSSVDK